MAFSDSMVFAGARFNDLYPELDYQPFDIAFSVKLHKWAILTPHGAFMCIITADLPPSLELWEQTPRTGCRRRFLPPSASSALKIHFWMPDDAGAVCPQLLVLNPAKDTVHVFHIEYGKVTGTIGSVGSVRAPRRGCARGTIVAISCFHTKVRLFRQSSSDQTWAPYQDICGHEDVSALRLSWDGRFVVVTGSSSHHLSMYNTKNGGFERGFPLDMGAIDDIEECHGGWLVATFTKDPVVSFVSKDGCTQRSLLRKSKHFHGRLTANPAGIAFLPWFGVFIKGACYYWRVQAYVLGDGMTPERLGWMTSVLRGAGKKASSRLL